MDDTFKFIMPAELTKGKDGEWKVSGLASTSSVDRQGEVILPEGIDATPIASGKGFFNFDHDNSPEATIGLLDGYKKTDRGMFVSGRLFKNHTKAKAVYEIMTSLGKSDKGRVGMSVEGKVIERDPFNKNIIKRCVVKNVAITMNPVNQDTYADIIKSFAGSEIEFDSTGQTNVQPTEPVVKSEEQPTFTASQVLQIVEKALGIGAGNAAAPSGRTGGDALSVSDMGEKPKKKKLKKLSKEMYKSHMDEMMNKLQQLYPQNTREEIWTAVKDRMSTTFEELDPDYVNKGGVGSGKKGHVTPTVKDFHKERQMAEAVKTGRLDQLRGVHQHFGDARKKAKGTEHEEYYKEKHREAGQHLMNRLANPDGKVEKGGQGSGVRGHRGQPMPGSGAIMEKLRAARARHKAESHPEKKAKHAEEIRTHVAAYNKLNPHLADD